MRKLTKVQKFQSLFMTSTEHKYYSQPQVSILV